MKRFIGIVAGLCLAAAALSQAPFTIVRPADNSKVREKVRILIPKHSIPDGGYVGIFVGGKFIEALLPNLNGKFYEYILDTKGQGIPDGNVKVEAVLYMDSQDSSPKILDRSSINVRVQNSVSIPIPANGFALRYKFRPNTEMIYRVETRDSISVISEAEAKMGGRAAELPLDSDKFRVLYAIDNAYGNGDGLIRMQAIPPPGKDHLYAAPVGETEATLWMDDELAPLYLRVNSTGNEVFGSIPAFYPIDGNTGISVDKSLMLSLPLPTLPAKRVKPGATWPSKFQLGNINMTKLHEVSSIVTRYPARGEFVGVEWEMGHPCAKLRNTIEVAANTVDGAKLKAQGRQFTDEKVKMNEVIWFALDRGVVVKTVLDMTIDTKAQMQGAGQGNPPGMGGGNSGLGGMDLPPGAGGDGDLRQSSGTQNVRQGLKGGFQPSVGNQPGQGGPNRGLGGQNRGGGGGGAQWARIRTQIIRVLEK